MRAISSSPRRWRRPPRSISWRRTAAGLICLALSKDRVDQLGLGSDEPGNNGTRHETAFTVSIEARHGRHHRHLGRAIARAPSRSRLTALEGAASEIVTPGHVFPLVAKPGGVLVRAGHTEAAVDVSRLGGPQFFGRDL